ncbi:uncharacterized protein GGS22DRAFT_196622 [Annulohypoxylon maeteangense]|uniref:uncharacterized protein n=1 Tax=Annulohypoxylon maeteangense TaxID=1927788 RepID=UPI0020083586|nr:uncharacterized protein GGS22DRAFT_196622 [Annulohypoxylon maeteangense]KAI0888745.1 hypothetical protein GGS22DRAFT_196622 [Annulohypoxylon maeteangense]
MECTASRRPPQTTLHIFHDNLANKWKSKAYCGREYYRSHEIVKWMLRQDTTERATNAGLLLTEVYHKSGSVHVPSSWKISDGDCRCLIVFAILLELDCGHLIDLFQRYNITDKRLPTREIPDTMLYENDLRKGGIQDTKQFWRSFLDKMWLYYPCVLDYSMRNAFLDPGRGRWIMPFAKRQAVNMKGGTAQVWEVAVQESLVPRKLAMEVGRSEYEDAELGKCYVFALKTFTQEYHEIFEWEREAYLAVQAKSELSGMVKFLGEYEIDEQLEDGSVQRTWNILLEFGEQDLEEFFASQRNYPPNLNPETIQFWNSLSNVAQALDSMHNLEVERENGRYDHFSGWHCDLKPDNILRVDGEFKLADFGFAKFKPKNPGGVPKQCITGGTETYGAPECDRARDDPTKSVTQAIDTWSFGCVLSVSATWVALGYQGVRAYDELRRIAIKKLRERKKRGENITVPAADDAFHNGVDVLPEVSDWHKYLKKVLRVNDTITGRIIDLVDETMLLAESVRPSKCSTLYDSIQSQLVKAQDHYDKLVEDGELESVAESVREALLSVENESSLVNSHALDDNGAPDSSSSSQYLLHPVERHPRLKSSRINKSRRINEVIQGKVAHRQEALGTPSDTAFKAIHAYLNEEIKHSEARGSSRIPLILGPTESQSRENLVVRESTQPALRVTPPFQHSTPPRPSKTHLEKEVITSGSPYSPTIINPLFSGYGNSVVESPDNDDFHIETKLPPNGYSQTSRESRVPTMSGLELSDYQDTSLASPSSGKSGIDPSWPMYKEHQSLKTKGKGLSRYLHPKKKDDFLKKFLFDRDIMFLVDNDMTMLPLWETMTTVLETLVSKVGGLDKNGLDLEFTLGGDRNACNVSDKQLISKFRDAKADALSQQYNINTDMAKTLTRIFDKYLLDTRRAKTLIILTDGVWGGTTNSTDVEKAIADFLKKPALAQKLEKRWFTIQFIACGNEVPDILQHLDDDIEKKYSIPDVIDTEHISGDVYKMIIGSFVDEYDVATSSQISPTSPSNPSFPGLSSTHAVSPSMQAPRTRPGSFRSATMSNIKSLLR